MEQLQTLSEGNCLANGRNIRALVLLTNSPQGVGGHTLKSIQIQFRETDVLIILKKDSPKGAKVAFIEANGLDDALYVMASLIKAKRVPWRDDRWASKKS